MDHFKGRRPVGPHRLQLDVPEDAVGLQDEVVASTVVFSPEHFAAPAGPEQGPGQVAEEQVLEHLLAQHRGVRRPRIEAGQGHMNTTRLR